MYEIERLLETCKVQMEQLFVDNTMVPVSSESDLHYEFKVLNELINKIIQD